ncbi:MAG: hypothetical protein AB1806_05005 [Acidobacteriota bacterium]
MIALFAVGLLSLIAQVVVLRELGAAFFGIELVYVLALAAWLGGTAAGALWGTCSPRLAACRPAAFALAGALILVDVALVRDLHRLLGGVPGTYLPFGRQCLAVLLAVLPMSLLFGALFVWAAGEWARRGAGLARSYAAECAGALAGGAWATVALKLGQSNIDVAVTAALLAGVVAIAEVRERRRTWRLAAGAAVVAAGLALLAGSARIDRALMRWSQPSLLDVVDTPFGRMALTGRAGQVAVFYNGALAFESEGTTAEVFAALSSIQHPHPVRALILGGGPEGVVREVRTRVAGEVVHVELDRRAHEVVSRYLPSAHDVPTRYGDARAILRKGLDAVDLAIVAMPAPVSGEASRFYTREFFELVRQVLTPGGVLAVRLPASENLWSVPMRLQNASVYRSLCRAFPNVVVVPGTTLFLFASAVPLPQDGDAAAGRLASRTTGARLATPAYIRYLYDNDRRAEVTRLLETTVVAETTDARPICYQHAMFLWLARFYPGLVGHAWPFSAWATRPWALLATGMAILAAIVGWMGRSPTRRLMALALVAGLSGMLLESTLLLHDQIKRGVFFEDVGILLGCFMAGMAFGALAVDRYRREVTHRLAQALVAALGVASAAVIPLMTRPDGLGFGGASLALAATGALVGALVAATSRLWAGPRDLTVSRLYAADLAGGCAGALLATIVLIPLGGLPVTVGFVAAVTVAAVAVLALQARR